MPGTDEASGSLLSDVNLEERIPAGHPLRKTRQVVNDALTSLDGDPTLADAILDRLVHNVHRLKLARESMRKAAARNSTLDPMAQA